MTPALQARILACRTLPSLPAVALRVLELCREEDTDLGQIAEALAHDPALGARMLRHANAAAVGARSQVTTLRQAVARLGTRSTLAVALTFSLVRDLRGPRAGGLDHRAFWRRAILSGVAGRALGAVGGLDPEELFLACLLQDVGVLALHHALGDEYAAFHRASGGEHDRLASLERAALGVDHAEVSWLLLRHWGLPELFQQAALFSHDLDRAVGEGAGLRRALEHVFLSGRLADAWSDGVPPVVARAALHAAARRVGIGEEAVRAALIGMADQLPEVASELEVDLGDPARAAQLVAEARALREDRGAEGPEAGPGTGLGPPGGGAPPASQDRALAQRAMTAAFELSRVRGQPITIAVCAPDEEQGSDPTSLARILGTCLRGTDFLAAAGEAVIAILPGTPSSGGLVVAQRMRRCAAVERQCVSLGVATYEPGAQLRDVEELLAAAERALDAARATGLGRLAYYHLATGRPVVQTD